MVRVRVRVQGYRVHGYRRTDTSIQGVVVQWLTVATGGIWSTRGNEQFARHHVM